MPPAPSRTLTDLVRRAIRLAARLRGARAFHPAGATFVGTVEGADGVVPPGTRALVRLSRAAGLPDPLPDVAGVAIRLVDAGGPGRHQDLLLSTVVGRGPLAYVLLPVRRAGRARYGSVWPCRVDGAVRVLTARLVGPDLDGAGLAALLAGVERGGARVDLRAVRLSGRAGRPLLAVRLGARLPPAEGEGLRFHPGRDGAGVRPVGPLALRSAGYVGSAEGRAGRRRRRW